MILQQQENLNMLSESKTKELFVLFVLTGENRQRFSILIKDLTYCTLNKIHHDDLLNVFQLYPDFAKSFVEQISSYI